MSESTTGIDAHDSEGESVQGNSDNQAQCRRASRLRSLNIGTNSRLGVPKLEVRIPSAIVRKREAFDMFSDVVIRASFQYKGESNTETIVGLRELKVLKGMENFQPSSPQKWRRGNGPDDHHPRHHACTPGGKRGATKTHPIGSVLLIDTRQEPHYQEEGQTEANRAEGVRRQPRPSHASQDAAHFVKNAQIKRHNKIADQLRKHGWTSWVEPRLFAKDGSLWKPDLIFGKEQKIAVVDVTVRDENASEELKTAW
ncbi:hypothetical protein chiPu_0021155 [Chiloscyllium punctatum]|uniref:Uncharacterized protein n=1 Tax=Chiloscyllium punctatum TaxID=137246 RepID=A0A401RNN5_CHIPU|nr:hypothetical protein [Chiloscyllium punctatum]